MVPLRASEPHDTLTTGAPSIRMSSRPDNDVVSVESKSSVSLLVPLVSSLFTVILKSKPEGISIPDDRSMSTS